MKLLGSSTIAGKAEKVNRGLGATKEDFEPKKNYLTEEEVEMAPNRRKPASGRDKVPRLLQDTTMSMQQPFQREDGFLDESQKVEMAK